MKTDHFFPKKAESLNLKNLLKNSVHYLAQNTVKKKKKSLKPLKSKYNFPKMFIENITGVGMFSVSGSLYMTVSSVCDTPVREFLV